MSHRFVWSVVAALSLGGLIAFISQSSAQRAGGGRAGGAAEPGMPGMAGPHGMPGRYVVANASPSQVLILDTATGQVYRAGEKDFKSVSDLPGMGRPGGGRDVRPPARDRGPEPKVEERPRDDRRPPAKDKEEAPQRRPERVKDAPPQREER
jgi:hypothetical protein